MVILNRKRTRSNTEQQSCSSSAKVLSELHCGHGLVDSRSVSAKSPRREPIQSSSNFVDIQPTHATESPFVPPADYPRKNSLSFSSYLTESFPLKHVLPVMFHILQFLPPQDVAQLEGTSKCMSSMVHNFTKHQLKHTYSCLKFGSFTDRCTIDNLVKPKTSILSLLNRCAFLFHLQNCTHPSPRCIQEVQSSSQLGEQYITEHMRAILVDWMIEVSVEYRLSTTIIHSSVNLLDRCLSRIPIPRRQLQLLGCVCLMLESQRPPSPLEYSMKIRDVVYICDSQYNSSQVEQMSRVVIASTFHKRIRTPPNTFCFLCQFLSMIHQPGFQREALAEPSNGIEHIVLSIFLSDLSLLDYGMLNFYPSTIAMSILFLSRTMVSHFSSRGLLISPFAVIEPKNREVRRLVGNCHEFLPAEALHNSAPFGSIAFEQFLYSAQAEASAVKRCITRLWTLHNDYIQFLLFNSSTERLQFKLLSQHTHMLKGLQEKYAPTGSIRAGAWMKLGALPENILQAAINKSLSPLFHMF